jgi:tetratricopeptide (TPR) repeat protein
MRRTIVIATTTLLAAAAFVLFGGALRESPSAEASAIPAEQAAAAFDPAFSSVKDAASLVLRLQQQIRQNPEDAASHALLGLAYQQRSRETGDVAYYRRAEAASLRALELDEKGSVALSGLTSLALTRHRFEEALVFARRARALAPTEPRTLGAIGDALVELGRYREGFATFDELGQVKPGLPAYARVSYARELLGDHDGAVAAMRLAAETAVPGSEAAAWTAVQLGKLFFLGGDRRSAERQYRIALAHIPGYAAAFDGLALVEAARKRLSRAIAFERRAVETAGLPEYVATLGDLLRRAGRPEAAVRQYAVFNEIERTERANGVRNGLEEALVHIDHGENVRAATALAYSDFRARPTVHAADTVAWGLARQGRCAEAKGYSKRALRLGTQDAALFFHRGMIDRCLGNRDVATRWFRRAVDLNPGFSVLWSPLAAKYAKLSS